MTDDKRRGARYLIVGGFNVSFTLAVFWILDYLFSETIGVQPVYWISALLGIANGFFWQRLLVWRSHGQWHLEFLKFLTMNLTTSAANSLLLYLAVDIGRFDAFPSQVAITTILVIFSFLLTRNWVFGRAGASRDASPILGERPRVDVFLQYYKPHVSGLTNMAAELAEYAALNGFEVHVHCVSASGGTHISTVDGVIVHAYRRSFSLGRGTFSLPLIFGIWRIRGLTGIAHAHMPYPESFLLAWILGPGWRLVATHHCDAPMTGGLANFIARALDASQTSFMKRAEFVVASSEDYARNSRLAGVIAEHNGCAIAATSVDRRGGYPSFAEPGKRWIGFLGRPTSEKGIDVALNALGHLPEDVCLLLAGPIVGLSEKATFDQEEFAKLENAGRIRSLGFLEEEEIADFYASIEVFILPSTNSFEAFGIVQVEAISAGTPVVASNLPGVRTIVQATGLGEISNVGDANDLADKIKKVLGGQYDRNAARKVLEQTYLSPMPQTAYLKIYERMSERPAIA